MKHVLRGTGGFDTIESIISDRDYRATARMILLTKVLGNQVEKKKIVEKITKNSFHLKIQDEWAANADLMENCGAVPSIGKDEMHCLAAGSFAISIDFRLTAPWYSKDDYPLYPMENPVRKEWVFKVPEMSAAGWKGVFFAASRAMNLEQKTLERLFGVANDDDTGSSGCLKFFPCFFNQVEYTVINPHGRRTRAGKNPITFETAPEGCRFRFTLLYEAEHEADPQTQAEDRELVARLIQDVFTRQGFGAKTNIGFGRAEIVPHKSKKPEPKKPVVQKDGKGGFKAASLAALGAAIEAQTGKKSKPQIRASRSGNVLTTASEELKFNNFEQLEKKIRRLAP